MFNVIILNNTFIENYANEYGGSVYIWNLNSQTKIRMSLNNFSHNFFIRTTDLMNGAIVHLENPSNILIENCYFYNNSGFGGSSIYYSESLDNFLLNLNRNVFDKNLAKFGAAGIFMKNKYEKIKPQEKNTFYDNFGYDYETPAFELKLNVPNFNATKNRTRYSLQLTPGVSNPTLEFDLLDYYGHHLSYQIGSSVTLQIKNKNFLDLNDSSLRFEGFSIITINQGIFFNDSSFLHKFIQAVSLTL